MAAAPLTRPLHLAISYDEEVGCLGVRPLIAHMRERGVMPLGCFVGEPTGMQVVVAHKTKVSYRVVVTGKPVHSALAPQGVNAVDYAARLVVFLQGINRRLAAGPSKAIQMTKWLVNRSLESSRQTAFEEEGYAQELVTATADMADGIAAFAERRSPEFRGW